MKFSLSVVAFIAFVAFVQATPVPQEETAAAEPIRPILNMINAAANQASDTWNNVYTTSINAGKRMAEGFGGFVENTAHTVGNGLQTFGSTFNANINRPFQGPQVEDVSAQ